MRLLGGLCLLAHLLSVRVQAGLSTTLLEDNGALIRKLKGGILYNNGVETSCQLAVLDSQSAAVSASCLDLGSNGLVLPNTSYAAYLDSGVDGVSAMMSGLTVTVHPQYDARTRSNNIAVVQYNLTEGAVRWQTPLSTPPTSGSDPAAFVRYAVEDPGSYVWRWPPHARDWGSPDTYCTNMSRLYADNSDVLRCSGSGVLSSNSTSTGCRVPYGTMVSQPSPGTPALIGLYSYTATDVSSVSNCLRGHVRSYFTALAPYVPFLEAVLGRALSFDGERGASNFTMGNTDPSQDPSGVQLFYGDLFRGANPEIPDLGGDGNSRESASSRTDVTSSAELSDEPSTGGGGLSKSTIIIIAVCTTVGGLLIACAAGVFIHRRRRARSMMAELKHNGDHGTIIDILGPDSIGRGGGGGGADDQNRYHTMDDIRNALGGENPPLYDDIISIASPRNSVLAAAASKGQKGAPMPWPE